jgi:plastocyanin
MTGRALPLTLGAISLVAIALFGAHSRPASAGTGPTVYANGHSPGNSSYSRPNVTINVGDTVTWTAQSGDHTATSYGGAFDSDAIAADSDPHSFTFQFTKAGIYRYYCREIPGMAAQITVNDPSGPPPTYEPTTTTTSPPLYHRSNDDHAARMTPVRAERPGGLQGGG